MINLTIGTIFVYPHVSLSMEPYINNTMFIGKVGRVTIAYVQLFTCWISGVQSVGRHFEESSLFESDFIYGNVWRNRAIIIFGVRNSIVSNGNVLRKICYRIAYESPCFASRFYLVDF